MDGSSRVDESDLIGGLLRGETDALRVLDGWIEAVLKSRFSSLRGEWDDLKQEIRLRVFRNLSAGHFDSRSSLQTYVQRISRNTCIDVTRLASRRWERPESEGVVTAPQTSTGGDVADWISRDLYMKILEGLSEGDRLLVELVFAQQRSYAEVAVTLGVSEGAVKVRVFRCKERILRQYNRLAE